MSQFEPLWVSSSPNQFCFMIISLKWGFVFKIIINLKPIFKSLIDQNEAKSSYQKKNGHWTNTRTFQENRTENRPGNRYLNYQNSRNTFFKRKFFWAEPCLPMIGGILKIEKFCERQKTENQKERTNQKTRRQRNGKSFIKELEREYKEIVMKVEDVLR